MSGPGIGQQSPHQQRATSTWSDALSRFLFGVQPQFAPGSPELARARVRWSQSFTRPSLRMILWSALLLAIVAWSLRGVEADLVKLIVEFTRAERVVADFFRPDWTVLQRGIEGTIVTVQMSIIGILFSALFSIPLGLLAARNVASPRVYSATRLFLSFVRTVPDLVWAIIFVVIVGLGPWAGTLAIIVGSTGSFGKLFAESIESVDPGPVDAVRNAGGDTVQVSVFAVLPQAMPLVLSYVLFYWESTVRNATVFGLVGAGGIGQHIQAAFSLLRYDRLAVYIICIFVAVVVIDRISALLRARLL